MEQMAPSLRRRPALVPGDHSPGMSMEAIAWIWNSPEESSHRDSSQDPNSSPVPLYSHYDTPRPVSLQLTDYFDYSLTPPEPIYEELGPAEHIYEEINQPEQSSDIVLLSSCLDVNPTTTATCPQIYPRSHGNDRDVHPATTTTCPRTDNNSPWSNRDAASGPCPRCAFALPHLRQLFWTLCASIMLLFLFLALETSSCPTYILFGFNLQIIPIFAVTLLCQSLLILRLHPSGTIP